MKNLFTVFFLFISSFSFSQKSVFDFGLPINLGNNFMNQSYIGVAQLGFATEVGTAKAFPFIPRVDLTYHSAQRQAFQGYSAFTGSIISLRFLGTTKVGLTSDLDFVAGLGLSARRTAVRFVQNGLDGSESFIQFGFDTNFGFRYRFKENFFGQLMHNFTYLVPNSNQPLRVPYNTNLPSILVGVGFNF
ncbi:MAG: hypothetical protein JXQ87_05315 [Bacteroidia bacterium]